MMQSLSGHQPILQHLTPSKVHCRKHLSFTTQTLQNTVQYTQMLQMMPVGAQLSQEHDGQQLPVAYLSHTFADTQWT